MKTIKETKTIDLEKSLLEKRDALKTFVFGNFGGKTKNVKEAKNIKKEIARILTELRARKI